jgi:hypothetical protein
MNLHNNVEKRIACIQRVFMEVQNYMYEDPPPQDVTLFLDREPNEFRPVAYESASMMIGIKELSSGGPLAEWKKFYSLAKEMYPAHVEVGLGLAFGKLEFSPTPHLDSLNLLMPWMIFDGLGYYYGLFKGRRTVINHIVPDFLNDDQKRGFDQGLGRRLWYIAKGEVKEVVGLVQSFPDIRHADLWRGIGIACGFVGGNDKNKLEQLMKYTRSVRKHFCAGISMAAISRILSESITEDIEFTYSLLCGKSMQNAILDTSNFIKSIEPTSDIFFPHWITQLENEFSNELQT